MKKGNEVFSMRKCKKLLALFMVAAFSSMLLGAPFTAMAADVQQAAAEEEASYQAMIAEMLEEEAQTEASSEGGSSSSSSELEDAQSGDTDPSDSSATEESSFPEVSADGSSPQVSTDSASDADSSSPISGQQPAPEPEPEPDPEPEPEPEPDPEPTLEEIYEQSEKITLRYDDRYTFKKKVESIVSLEITSTRTGSTKADVAVLKTDSSSSKKVIASGCGRALVTLQNGTTYGVKVVAAPISLLLIVGQSNAEGRVSKSQNIPTYQKQWIVNEEGQVYSTYAPATAEMYEEVGWYGQTAKALSISNAKVFIPGSLTNNSYDKIYKHTNNLTNAEGATGKSGIDSALAYEWHKLTGEKVWILNAAHRGSSITSWQPGDSKTDNNFWQAVELYKSAEKLLSKEIAAGHYTLSRKGVFWLQGEQDKTMSASKYLDYFKKMNAGFQTQLNGSGIANMKKAISFTGVMMVRAASSTPAGNSDLTMTGPRLAQYYMANSSSYPNVYLASQAEESWTTDANVANYFKNKYGSQAKYTAANPTKSKITMPTKVSQLHSTIHYSQMAYNEIGMDAADNICYALGYAKAPSSKVTSIQLVTADGYTKRNGKTVSASKGSTTKFAVKVYPTYLAKGVQVTTTKNTSYSVSGIKLKAKGSNKITVKAGSKSSSITIKSK
jgi:hypothetical protein